MSVSSSIGARLDALASERPAWRLVALVSLGGIFEFYDLMMTAYVSPALVKAGVFHEGRAGLFGQSDQASFAAATFLGLFFGALVFSRTADRLGRRAVFTLSLLWYALTTLLMAAAPDARSIDVFRFLSGLGIGVELVTIDAYVAEISPARMRGRAFAANQAIQFLAVPLVAFVAWKLSPLTVLGLAGWRLVMALGASGAVVVWLIRRSLPESPRWLERRGDLAGAEAIVAAMERAEPPPIVVPTSKPERPEAPRVSLREAFAGPYQRITLMLIVFNIFQAIGFYGFGNWLPSLIAAQGHSTTKSLAYSFAIAFAYPLSPLLCLLIADRMERKAQIIAAAVGVASLGVLFSLQSDPVLLIALGVAITFCSNLLSFSYHAYQTELYPTHMRATAVGFVYAFSRISTVFSSYAIAALLAGFGARGVFAFITLAMALVILSVGLFGSRTARRNLEETGGEATAGR